MLFKLTTKKEITMRLFIILITIIFSLSSAYGQNCGAIGDTDGDGLCNDIDPCPTIANPNPVDGDGDGVYNACDNCPDNANADQADADGDGIGDACDPCTDSDGDGVCGAADKCPGGDDRQDIDRDGIPDACDDCTDLDADNICDDVDDCDNRQIGKSCDDGNPCTTGDQIDSNCKCRGVIADSDGDGVCDNDDLCPDYDDRLDFDGDGVPDGCDDDPVCRACNTDERGNMIICRFSASAKAYTISGRCDDLGRYFDQLGAFEDDRNHCGPCTCEDKGDQDSDGDGVCDSTDPCPDDATISKDDGCPCDDPDSDGDGVCDSADQCQGSDDRLDKDGDGVPDDCDDFSYCTPDADDTFEWIDAIKVDDTTLEGQSSDGYHVHTEAVRSLYGASVMLSVTPDMVDNVCEVGMAIFIDPVSYTHLTLPTILLV